LYKHDHMHVLTYKKARDTESASTFQNNKTPCYKKLNDHFS